MMRAASRAVLASLGVVACSATPIEVPGTPGRRAAAVHSVHATAVAPGAPDDTVTTRARAYAVAYQAMRDGRSDEARQGFATSVRSVPELADHALYHQARLARAAGDDEEARDALGRLVVEHPDSVWLAAAAVDRGQIALDDGKADEAAAWFARATDAEDAATANAAKLGLAKADLARGRLGAAYQLADGLRGKPGVTGSEARTLGEALEARGPAALGIAPDELRLRTARARLREGRAAEAREVLAPLSREGNPLRGEAALIEARSYGKASPAEAAAAYEVAIRSSSAADVAGTALYERGKAAWNPRRERRRRRRLRSARRALPGPPRSVRGACRARAHRRGARRRRGRDRPLRIGVGSLPRLALRRGLGVARRLRALPGGVLPRGRGCVRGTRRR